MVRKTSADRQPLCCLGLDRALPACRARGRSSSSSRRTLKPRCSCSRGARELLASPSPKVIPFCIPSDTHTCCRNSACRAISPGVILAEALFACCPQGFMTCCKPCYSPRQAFAGLSTFCICVTCMGLRLSAVCACSQLRVPAGALAECGGGAAGAGAGAPLWPDAPRAHRALHLPRHCGGAHHPL